MVKQGDSKDSATIDVLGGVGCRKQQQKYSWSSDGGQGTQSLGPKAPTGTDPASEA